MQTGRSCGMYVLVYCVLCTMYNAKLYYRLQMGWDGEKARTPRPAHGDGIGLVIRPWASGPMWLPGVIVEPALCCGLCTAKLFADTGLKAGGGRA